MGTVASFKTHTLSPVQIYCVSTAFRYCLCTGECGSVRRWQVCLETRVKPVCSETRVLGEKGRGSCVTEAVCCWPARVYSVCESV